MKALKTLGVLLLLFVAVVLVLGLIAPKEYNVERSITIDAPSGYVWSYVSTLEEMHDWSPWKDRDTNQIVEFTGESGTIGSKMTWEGNDQVGKGSQEITSMTEKESVETGLIFYMPLGESKSDAYILLNNGGKQTEVTWGFNGNSPYPMNAMLLFMNMDEMLGKDFDEGLNNLKTKVEADYKDRNNHDSEISKIDLDQRVFLLKRDTVKFDAIGDYFMQNLGPVHAAFLGKYKAEEAGLPSGLYYTWDEDNMQTYMGVGIQVNSTDVEVEGFETVVLEPSSSIQMDYYGSYDGLGPTHDMLNEYIMSNGLDYNGPAVEEYITDPTMEPDTSKWYTRVIYYVK